MTKLSILISVPASLLIGAVAASAIDGGDLGTNVSSGLVGAAVTAIVVAVRELSHRKSPLHSARTESEVRADTHMADQLAEIRRGTDDNSEELRGLRDLMQRLIVIEEEQQRFFQNVTGQLNGLSVALHTLAARSDIAMPPMGHR